MPNPIQNSLFDTPTPPPRFDGDSYIEAFDSERLTGQWQRVWEIMSDGKWRTLAEIRNTIWARFPHADSEAAISARLRDFRKARFGGHTVERRRRGIETRGLFEYRLIKR